jgi:FkbM family methyltransferase
MNLRALLVSLDRRTRGLDAVGLGAVRRLGRRLLGATVARRLEVEVDGIAVGGNIQHRGYLERLARSEAEPFTTRLLTRAFAPGSTFVDVGAFLGIYTLRAARAGARVLSVEANPGTRALLTANLRRNRLTERVTVLPFALSDGDGTVDYFVGDGDQSASGLAETRSNVRPIRVETRRLDDLLEGVLPAVDVVKIDVEGAELRVLDGMSRLLDSGQPLTLVAECNPAGLARLGATPRQLVERLEAAGFEVRAIDETNERLLPADAALSPNGDYVNLHAVR